MNFNFHFCIFLFFFSFDVHFVFGQDEYFEDINQYLSEDLIQIYCNDVIDNLSGIEAESFEDCGNRVLRNIRSLKLAEYINFKRILSDSLNNQSPELIQYLSGKYHWHADDYLDKLSLLQDIADDKRINNICIYHLQNGFSVLNFLGANSKSKIFVLQPFDKMKENLIDDSLFYIQAYQDFLQESLSDKIVSFMIGPKTSILKNFNNNFINSDFRCNLLYIDGHVSHENMLQDLRYLFPLLDYNFNRIVIDGYQTQDVKKAFLYYLKKINAGVECPISLKNSSKGYCGYKVNVIHRQKGFLPTPCIAMRTNTTDGLHIDFLTSVKYCINEENSESLVEPSINTEEEIVIASLY